MGTYYNPEAVEAIGRKPWQWDGVSHPQVHEGTRLVAVLKRPGRTICADVTDPGEYDAHYAALYQGLWSRMVLFIIREDELELVE